MTKEQAEKFLKEVKGRKIRMSACDKDWYIIPTGEWVSQTDKYTYWWQFECINENNKIDWHFIYEGFSEDKYGNCWEYFPDFERYLELLVL